MKTFEYTFYEYFKFHSPSVSWGRQKEMVDTYEKHIHEFFGELLLKDIDHHIVLQPIRRLEAQGKTRTSNQLRQLIGRIFDYGFYCGYCHHNPIDIVKKSSKRHTSNHFPFVQSAHFHQLYKEVKELNILDLCHQVAFLVIILSACRASEVCGMKWQELDFKSKMWFIPPERMKTRISHEVMLSEQIIDLLLKWKKKCTSDVYVFPSRYKTRNYITGCSIRRAILKTSFRYSQSLHGFRHLFSTTCYESGRWRDDAIELCIAHKPLSDSYSNSKRFYNHAKHRKEKRLIMQWYADTVEGWIFNAPFEEVE